LPIPDEDSGAGLAAFSSLKDACPRQQYGINKKGTP